MKFSGLAILALALVCVQSSYADPVHLQTAGHPFGDTTYQPGADANLGFTLAADTQITALSFSISPPGDTGTGTYGTYSVTVTGPNAFDWSVTLSSGWPNTGFPTFLSAGTYNVDFHGISCTGSCVFGSFSLLRYEPPTITQTGGSVSNPFDYGFNLEGNTVTNSPVPEPATAALVGTGLLAALAGMRRRFVRA